jgi:hypothetical protein
MIEYNKVFIDTAPFIYQSGKWKMKLEKLNLELTNERSKTTI